MTTHNIETWPQNYRKILANERPFLVIEDSGGFEVGDAIVFEEFIPVEKTRTGRSLKKRITSRAVGGSFGILPGWIVLGLSFETWEVVE